MPRFCDPRPSIDTGHIGIQPQPLLPFLLAAASALSPIPPHAKRSSGCLLDLGIAAQPRRAEPPPAVAPAMAQARLTVTAPMTFALRQAATWTH